MPHEYLLGIECLLKLRSCTEQHYCMMKAEPFKDSDLGTLCNWEWPVFSSKMLFARGVWGFCTNGAPADFDQFEFESYIFTLFYLQSVDMNGWRLESPDQEDVVSVLNTASNTVVADIQELSPTVQTLHWVAPSYYLGNRVRNKREKEITPALMTACIQVSYFETGSRSHFSRFVPQMSLQEFAIKLKKYWTFFFLSSGFILRGFPHLPDQIIWDSQRGHDSHGQKAWCRADCA